MPKFLQDTPNTRLTNADGTFEANKSILEEVVSNNNLPRKLIALSGKWGSGKSTVINQLDKEKFHTITFDIWGIIEDQQFKRSFLTFLYRKLLETKKKICLSLPQISISPLLNAIKGRTSQTTVENTPLWKPAAKFLGTLTALSLLWVGCSSIVDAVAKLEFLYSPYAGRANFLITILLADTFIKFFLLLVNKQNIKRTVSFSLIVIVIAGLIAFFQPEHLLYIVALVLVGQIPLYLYLKEHIKQLWSGLPTYIFPFIGGGTAEAQSTSVETSQKDLGHDDFLQLYEHLMAYWKQVLEKKPLIIVIDNLDRLETKDARLIIDQLSLFFTEELEDKGATLEVFYPWFILPLDKTRFFEDNELGIAAEYFEKFFPIRLEISDISNGGWKKILEDKLKEAFEEEIPIFDQEEAELLANNLFQSSIELFRSLFYCYDMKLYPRDIIYFVNKTVYYYLVIEKLYTVKTKEKIYKSDWFKIAFITACYVMFIEERDGQSSLKEWLDRPNPNPAKNESDAQSAQREQRIKTLFGHYAIRWKLLLCMGYYQTINPYDALYHGFIEELIKTGNTTELIDLRDKTFPSKDVFNILFKNVWISMNPCLDMQAYVNTLKSGLEMLK